MMKLVASRDGITLPTGTEVEATVGVGATRRGFEIEIELKMRPPGLPRAEADSLVEKSHAACPYSNATRGDVSVRLVLA
jgi:osmotically inducible protein OsmC